VLSTIESAAATSSSAASTESKLANLFNLVEKIVLVHGIFDADSDGVVSAGDLIKIAKGPAAAAPAAPAPAAAV
jgi:Ca2+-binding EF-hand superfamily protein